MGEREPDSGYYKVKTTHTSYPLDPESKDPLCGLINCPFGETGECGLVSTTKSLHKHGLGKRSEALKFLNTKCGDKFTLLRTINKFYPLNKRSTQPLEPVWTTEDAAKTPLPTGNRKIKTS